MKKSLPKLTLRRETVAALDPELAKQAAGGVSTVPRCTSHYVSGDGACTTTQVD